MAGRFALSTIFNAKDRVSPVLRGMAVSVDKFTKAAKKELDSLESINDKLVGGVNKMATTLTGATVAVAAGLAEAAKPGMAFEQQMADLGASFLKTRSQIGPLEKEALSLGAATKFSATEVAGAMESMSKAGFDEEQTLRGIKGMTYAAAAAGEDLIETTANVSAVMKGMQIDVGMSSQVADVLALASVKTASSISSLAESLSKAGPVAKQFNIGLTDVTAMVASLQDAGIDASEAGSAVATMLTKLATPSKNAQAQMKKLGISFQDDAGNMKAPADVLNQLVTAAKKSGGNMKQAAFFAEMLGLRGQKAGLLLKEALASGKYDNLVDELEKANGTAKKMADLRMNTLTGDIDVFTENVKGLGIQLFSLNSGPLRDVVQKMTKWLDKNQAKILEDLQTGIAWFIENLPTMVTWVKRLAIAWAVFNSISVVIKGAQMAIAGYELAVKAAGLAQWAFGKSGKVWWATKVGIEGSLGALGAFNKEAAAGKTGLEGLRAGLNASKLGEAINGVQGKLGKLGLLGAALGVGVAIGSWANETFGLDEKLSGLMAKFTGLDDQINKMGGRTDKVGVEGSDQHFADGSVRSPNGTWKYKSPARIAKEAGQSAAWVDKHRGSSPTQYTDDASVSPLMVTPQERTALSISQHTETTQAVVTLKDETGRAEVTKQPKGKGFSLQLKPTGAF